MQEVKNVRRTINRDDPMNRIPYSVIIGLQPI